MYRLKENLVIRTKGRTNTFKKGEDFFRNHILIENNQAVVLMTPVSGSAGEQTVNLPTFEALFFKVEGDYE